MWSSAVVGYLPQGSTRVVTDAFLLTTCVEWLFELPSFQLKPVCLFCSDLSHQQGVSASRTASYWIFLLLFFAPFCINPRNCSVWEFLEICSSWNTQTILSGTTKHAMVKVAEVTFFWRFLSCICMIICIVLLSCNWLIWIIAWISRFKTFHTYLVACKYHI